MILSKIAQSCLFVLIDPFRIGECAKQLPGKCLEVSLEKNMQNPAGQAGGSWDN